MNVTHMRQNFVRGIMLLCICAALQTGSISAVAASSDFNLAGLALHQQTGRDIYLGGIYFDKQVPKPDDYVGASGPKLMEYTVVARRTSIRSLLGGILLQSEVATGKAPDQATTDLANSLLSAVSGSLYAGDSLEFLLNESDETIAYLNNQELARVDDGTVADYLLMGWVGERGPSTVFRNSIMSAEINPVLRSALAANTYSVERQSQVASWIGVQDENLEAAPGSDASNPVASIATAAATPPPKSEPEPEPEIAPEVATAQKAPEESLAAAQAAPKAPLSLPEPKPEQPSPIADPASGPVTTHKPVQVASLLPTANLLSEQPADDVRSLDVKEYSQRLSNFHSQLIGMVYGQIRYPARAVRRGLEGRLELDITLLENGELVDITIVQPSGHAILDKAAVKAAKSALSSGALSAIDPVAIAEFRNGQESNLVIPVPVQFMLTE